MRQGEGLQAVEAVARGAYGRLVAFLAAETRDVAAAEDALSDAFQQAVKSWSDAGVPSNPEGWLVTVARRRLIDQGRRRRVREGYATNQPVQQVIETMPETDIPERRLELMFVCAHPAIESSVRAPLMLQTILNVPVDVIARAMLVQPSTLAQRLVRAKARIKAAGVPFRTPEPQERLERLPALLDAIYLAYGAGWEDVAHGADPVSGHAVEALFLARLLAQLVPEEPEALGLLALMLHSEARRGARRSQAGAYIALPDQDVSLWDPILMIEGETALQQAAAMRDPGRFQIEAAIQSAIARRATGAPIDWEAIVRFSDHLVSLTRSPVAMVNHAAALLHINEPGLALHALDIAASDPRMSVYQPYWAVRAATLSQVGDARSLEVRNEAKALTRDPAITAWLDSST